MSEETDDIEAKLCAFLDGELGEAERAEIEKYLAANPQQAAVMRELRSARKWVGALPRERAPEEVLEAVQGQLERGALLEGVGEDGGRGAGWVRRWPGAVAMAAIVMLVVGLGVVLYDVLWPGGVNRQAEYAVSKAPSSVAAPATTGPVGGQGAEGEAGSVGLAPVEGATSGPSEGVGGGDELTLAKKVGGNRAGAAETAQGAVGEEAGAAPSLALGPPAPAGLGVGARERAEEGTGVAEGSSVAPSAAPAVAPSVEVGSARVGGEGVLGGPRPVVGEGVDLAKPQAAVAGLAPGGAEGVGGAVGVGRVRTMVVMGVEGRRRVEDFLAANGIAYTVTMRGEGTRRLAASAAPGVLGGNARGMSDGELMAQRAMTTGEGEAQRRRQVGSGVEQLIVATVPVGKVEALGRAAGESGVLNGAMAEGAGGVLSNAAPLAAEVLRAASAPASEKDARVDTSYFVGATTRAFALDRAAAATGPAGGATTKALEEGEAVRVEIVCRPGGVGAVPATTGRATTEGGE